MKVRLLGAERKGCVRETDARSIGEAEGRLLVFSSVVEALRTQHLLDFFFAKKMRMALAACPRRRHFRG